MSMQASAAQPVFNIGSYDGGFERIISSPRNPEQDAKHRQFDQDFESAGPSKHWNLSNFDIGRPLGKGESKDDPFILVLKCLTKDEIMSQDVQTQVRREIEIMQQLRHPNIIRLYGWFHDATRIFLMLEYAGRGELFKQLSKNGRFSEKRSSRVIHRDIKPENLLIGLSGEIKIGDFGWSVYSPVENSQRTLAGTLSYVAPEMILGQPYGKSIDIWALGVLTFELICGEEPFGADTTTGPRLVHSRICRCDVHFPDHVSRQARSFILRLLRLNPAERLPLARVAEESWILDNM
ncbi:hypothetical protein CI109_102191 [Kwoniella shandongensis]|uniref:Aurora kinase n=1 Tax=Kwoniella shandongensis TaxID=1734106 RepID=A0AAJ8MU96_9TREE